jgi:hypothetical protein
MGMESVGKAERVALVCVHGVAPHPRYEFQDQVAGDLCARLNEAGKSGAWKLEVVNPAHVLAPGTDDPRPTITRVSSDDAHANVYDVTEAYWSPLDKGATNWFWTLLWIFKTVFAPFNTVARIEAPFVKQFFDYSFIGGAIVIAFALFALSIYATWDSLLSLLKVTGLFRQTNVSDTIAALNATVVAPGGRPVAVILWLLVGIVGGFLVSQAIAAGFKTWQQRKALLRNPASIWHRVLAMSVIALIGGAFVYAMAVARFSHGSMGWEGVGFLVVIFLSFQIGRGLLINFIVEFFGDVQIYTTRDENESKFFGLSDEILDTAVTAIIRAVSPKLNGGIVYDRVIVLGHSLGATIATDAITRLRQVSEQGALTREEFGRLRAFIMLGSSLEKTDYFFDVAGATPSVSYEEWRGSAYQRIFDDDAKLACGSSNDKIFWINYWYFQDPICNEIRSYDACRNEEGHKHMTLIPFHPLLHSDYLDDPWFWFSSDDGHLGALDIITGAACR